MTILVEKQFVPTMRRATATLLKLMQTFEYAVTNYPKPYAPYNDTYYTTVREPLPEFAQFREHLTVATPLILAGSIRERAARKPTELLELDRVYLSAPSELGLLTAVEFGLSGALQIIPQINGEPIYHERMANLNVVLSAAAISHGVVEVTGGYTPPPLVACWNGSSELAH